MDKYEIDTDKLEEASFNIETALTNFERVLSEYLARMQKVPNETKEWQGNASEDFVEILKNDYQAEYIPLIKSIRKIADEMAYEAQEYKAITNNYKI